MAKRKAETSLSVYLNNLHLGYLSYQTRRSLVFQYAPGWLERENCFPISRSLPLREEKFDGDEVFAYFDNLLPEGAPTRQRIAARMHADSDQVFDLLKVIGQDCVGALQFLDTDESPLQIGPSSTPLSESEIAQRLRNLSAFPLGASEEEDFRISIAGVQEKTALLKLNDQWCLPHSTTPTSHIFKPQIGELKPGVSFSDSVENEWLCAKITEAFGLSVAKTEITQFEDVKVLIVERFDRRWHKGKLLRLPQEDICQAMGVPSFEKYQSDGGPGIIKIMDLLNESPLREKNRDFFMKAQIVFFLLAAIDGHAKNFSIRWGPQGFWLTPLYDILSAQPVTDRGVYQYEKIKMAMAIGNKPYWRVRDIFRRHFIQTAKLTRYDTQKMDLLIDETLEQIPHVISQVSSELSPDFPSEIAESIFQGIEKRAKQLAPSYLSQ